MHSKIGFGVVVLYVLCYAVIFSKKMDMMLFPYNSMFSSNSNEASTPYAYIVKADNNPVKFTGNLYWKKDFLEQAPAKYSTYLSEQKVSYIEKYLKRKNMSALTKNIAPSTFSDRDWFEWYAKFSGITYNQSTCFELIKYDLIVSENSLLRKDSCVITRSVR